MPNVYGIKEGDSVIAKLHGGRRIKAKVVSAEDSSFLVLASSTGVQFKAGILTVEKEGTKKKKQRKKTKRSKLN